MISFWSVCSLKTKWQWLFTVHPKFSNNSVTTSRHHMVLHLVQLTRGEGTEGYSSLGIPLGVRATWEAAILLVSDCYSDFTARNARNRSESLGIARKKGKEFAYCWRNTGHRLFSLKQTGRVQDMNPLHGPGSWSGSMNSLSWTTIFTTPYKIKQ